MQMTRMQNIQMSYAINVVSIVNSKCNKHKFSNWLKSNTNAYYGKWCVQLQIQIHKCKLNSENAYFRNEKFHIHVYFRNDQTRKANHNESSTIVICLRCDVIGSIRFGLLI